jgi:ELWxxDGT repeat protein
VKDILPGKVQYLALSSSPEELVTFQGKLFFTADTPSAGRELWVSDGTANGTTLFRDLRSGSADSNPRNLIVVNGKLFFTAITAAGRELWVSDGTAGGTHLVKDIRPGAAGSNGSQLTAVGSRLFFTANNGQTGTELWASDGTAAGTVQVRDIQPGSAGSSPEGLTNSGGTLFFSANDGTHGRELWKSGGAAQSTALVRDLKLGVDGSHPSFLTALGGALFFSAENGIHGEELFVSDGTTAGTRLAADIARPGGSAPTQLTVAGGTLYFSADDGIVGREIFRVSNAAPAISDLGGPIGYTLNSPGISLASAAQVTDADNAVFRGGKLTVEIISGSGSGNRLEFTGGNFTVDANNNVHRNGVVIGRRNSSGGIGTTKLEISFNSAASKSIVLELLRAVRFRTVGGTSTAQRQISFTLTDGDGGVSDERIKTVNVT